MVNIRAFLILLAAPLGVLTLAPAAAQTAAPAAAPAMSRQDLAAVQRAVRQFMQAQTAGLPGQTSYTIDPIDNHLSLNACPAPEAFLPNGARLWGHSTVGVRCIGDKPWTVFVPVQVKVVAEYLVTARPLSPGQAIAASDLATRSGDLTMLPAGILTDQEQAIGKTPTSSLGAGQALRGDLLRSPTVVQSGQSVVLQSKGPGFVVRAEGKALTQAADGQVVQVRSASGSTVSGIARAGGVVDVTF
jgi:flagellar basal body P-ring formation protein FlgA